MPADKSFQIMLFECNINGLRDKKWDILPIKKNEF